MDQKPKHKCYTHKTFRKKHKSNWSYVIFGNEFLDMTPKAWSTTKIIHKLDFIKINFYKSLKTKYLIKKIANHMYGKKVLSRIYKGVMQLNNKKTQLKNS